MIWSDLLREHRETVVDAVIAVLLFAVFVFTVLVFRDAVLPAGAGREVYLIGAASTLPLAVRRRAPLVCLGLVTVGAMSFRLIEGCCDVVVPLSLVLAIFSAAAYGRAIARELAITGALLGMFVADAVVASRTVTEQGWFLDTVWAIIPTTVVYAFTWVFGHQARRRRQSEEALAARTVELEVERDLNAERAAVAERLRIARELHDALGHHISVIGLQAAGASRVLRSDPDRAQRALEAVETATRHASQELHHALQLLREAGERDRRPIRLARLDPLADELRAAGVEVTVHADPLPPDMPSTVDLAATRVVQESLTNVLRHAGTGASAWVRIRTEDETLQVVVENDGRGRPDRQVRRPTGGRGLTGMRERIELLGGRFSAGRRPDGGFKVTATLPMDVAAPEEQPSGESRDTSIDARSGGSAP